MELYIIKKISKSGNPYIQLYADLGYRLLPLTFDVAVIVELTGLSFEYVNNIKPDFPVNVLSCKSVGK